MARLLLVDPKPPFDVFENSLVDAPECPSLTLGMLAGAALADGHDVRVLDLRFSDEPDERLRCVAADFAPTTVGFSTLTYSYPATERLAAVVRQTLPDATLAIGGAHAQAMSADELARSPFDAAAFGEGENTLRELLAGRPLDQIAGLAVRTPRGVRRNPPRPLIEDVDQLPLPAYCLFDGTRRRGRTGLWKSRRIAMMESSRGCPFRCEFCAGALKFGPRWRAKSARRVVREIGYLLDAGFDEIHFHDDGFTTSLPRAKEICERILSSGRRFSWELFNGIRVDCVDDEFLNLAARSGCRRVRFGVEFGNDAVRAAAGKRVSADDIRRVFGQARRHGIETVALFMLGYPTETPATLEETIRFAERLPGDFARVSIFVPFPGTAIYERLRQQGQLRSANWEDFHFHSRGRLVFAHPQIAEDEVFRAYRRFYRRYYFRAAYLLERVRLGVKRGTLWRDISYFVRKFLPELRRQ